MPIVALGASLIAGLVVLVVADLVLAYSGTPAGIGIGVELVTIDAYIAELMPAHIRGRAFAVNQVVQFLAVPRIPEGHNSNETSGMEHPSAHRRPADHEQWPVHSR